MPRQTKAYLYTLLAVLFWSTAASAFKFALQTVSPQNLLLYATALSVLVLSCILAIQGKLGKIRQMPAKSLRRCLLLGVLNPFLYYMILFSA
ncbi:MAG: EamA family transporter [Desulfobulbus sp.]|nr:EamA family transporter [Desulfobulbus sp.]